MYISPYYEAVPLEAVQVSALESPERPDTDEPDSNSIGEFAQILAGMLRETQPEQIPQTEDGAADTVLLAEAIEIPIAGEIAGESAGEIAGEIFPVPEQSLLSARSVEMTFNSDTLATEEAAFADFTELGDNLFDGVETLLYSDYAAQADAVSAEGPVETEMEMEAELAVDVDADAPAVFNQPDDADTAILASNAGSAAQAEDAAQMNQKPAANTSGEKDFSKSKISQGEEAAQPAFVERREEVPVAAKSGEDKKSRLEETRGRDRRGARLSVEVNDLRGLRSAQTEAGQRVNVGHERGAATEAGTREITLELRLPEQGHKSPALETNWATKSAHAFEDLLARELHQNFNNDIVRHASMILRDDNRGTIRLALKPDSLGNVKIRLEMAENKISGHIIVESEEALRAFEREIHFLEQAFKESGFADASLNMSLANDGSGAEQFQQWAQTRSLLTESDAASRYDAREQTESPLTFERGQTIINMLA